MARLKTLKPRLGALPPRVRYLPREEAEAVRLRAREQAHVWRAWYKTARWRALRLEVLARDGYRCRQTGVMLTGKYPADDSPTVDHIVPHRGDPVMFWDPNNLQSVSKAWHDSVKQSQERRGGGGPVT
jgi:5-methylcytosine-specific restriction protein A